MDRVPITRLDELNDHLDALVADPTISLDAKLFDHVELQLTEANAPPLIPILLPKITAILKQYTQDPAILASMATKLLGPVSFTQALSLASTDSLVHALRSPAPSANLLAMTILHKAARSPADAAILALVPELIPECLVRFLAAPQVEVGEKGGRVLGDLLDVDSELPPPPPLANGGDSSSERARLVVIRKAPGQGRLWRRVFHDRDIYGLLLSLVAGTHPSVASSSSPHQRTLAQGRLLRILPRLATLNFAAVTQTEFPDLVPGGGGLLQFAALRMVDRDDTLMHLSLVDFFEVFVSVMRMTDHSASKMEVMKALLRQAMTDDAVLREALLSLPLRTVPEEADALRRWLRELMPGVPVRVAGWE